MATKDLLSSYLRIAYVTMVILLAADSSFGTKHILPLSDDGLIQVYDTGPMMTNEGSDYNRINSGLKYSETKPDLNRFVESLKRVGNAEESRRNMFRRRRHNARRNGPQGAIIKSDFENRQDSGDRRLESLKSYLNDKVTSDLGDFKSYNNGRGKESVANIRSDPKIQGNRDFLKKEFLQTHLVDKPINSEYNLDDNTFITRNKFSTDPNRRNTNNVRTDRHRHLSEPKLLEKSKKNLDTTNIVQADFLKHRSHSNKDHHHHRVRINNGDVHHTRGAKNTIQELLSKHSIESTSSFTSSDRTNARKKTANRGLNKGSTSSLRTHADHGVIKSDGKTDGVTKFKNIDKYRNGFYNFNRLKSDKEHSRANLGTDDNGKNIYETKAGDFLARHISRDRTRQELLYQPRDTKHSNGGKFDKDLEIGKRVILKSTRHHVHTKNSKKQLYVKFINNKDTTNKPTTNTDTTNTDGARKFLDEEVSRKMYDISKILQPSEIQVEPKMFFHDKTSANIKSANRIVLDPKLQTDLNNRNSKEKNPYQRRKRHFHDVLRPRKHGGRKDDGEMIFDRVDGVKDSKESNGFDLHDGQKTIIDANNDLRSSSKTRRHRRNTGELGARILRGPESTITPAGYEVMFRCEFSLVPEQVTWWHRAEKPTATSGDNNRHGGGGGGGGSYTELDDDTDFRESNYSTSTHGNTASLRVLAGSGRFGQGYYRCSAMFGPLALASVPAKLTLASLGDFKLNASDSSGRWEQHGAHGLRLRVPQGNRVPLICPDVDSMPRAQIQFYKFNKPLSPNTPQLPSGTLVLPAVTVQDSGRYTCSALNELNDEVARTNVAFTLEVYRADQREPPRFLQTPRSAYTVLAGRRVLLECSGVGNPVPIVQWSRQGGTIIMTSSPSPITASSSPSQGGRYNGPQHSGGNNGYVDTTSSSMMTMTADQSNAAINVPRILITEYGLQIENVSLEDTGVYECTLLDPTGRSPPVTHRIRMDVDSPAVISDPPPVGGTAGNGSAVAAASGLSQYAQEGGRVTMECGRVSGVPPPDVYWLLNARPADADRAIRVQQNRLIIDPVSRTHAGAVQCFARNRAGESYRAGVLRVAVKEVSSSSGTGGVGTGREQAGNSRHRAGNTDGTSPSHAGGGRPMMMGGHHSGGGPRTNPGTDASEASGRRHHYSQRGQDGSQMGTSSGGGKKPHRGKDGRPRGRGRDKKRNRDAVMIPPSRPNVTRLSDESVMVRWSVPENDGLQIYFFKVQYRDITGTGGGSGGTTGTSGTTSGGHHNTSPSSPPQQPPQPMRGRKGWITTNDEIPPHIRSYEVNNLEPDHTYRFHIAAVYSNNDNMLGPNSERFHLQRGEFLGRGPLLPAPVLIRTEALGPHSVQIHWQYAPDAARPADGFYLYFRPATTAGEYVKATVDGERARQWRLDHLAADTMYEIKLQSFTASAASDFSAILTQRTAKPLPGSQNNNNNQPQSTGGTNHHHNHQSVDDAASQRHHHYSGHNPNHNNHNHNHPANNGGGSASRSSATNSRDDNTANETQNNGDLISKPDGSDTGSNDNNDTMIVCGATAGVCLIVALVACGVYVAARNRKRRRMADDGNGVGGPGSGGKNNSSGAENKNSGTGGGNSKHEDVENDDAQDDRAMDQISSGDNKDGGARQYNHHNHNHHQPSQQQRISADSNGYLSASSILPHSNYQVKDVQLSGGQNGCARVNITPNPLAEDAQQADKNAGVTNQPAGDNATNPSNNPNQQHGQQAAQRYQALRTDNDINNSGGDQHSNRHHRHQHEMEMSMLSARNNNRTKNKNNRPTGRGDHDVMTRTTTNERYKC